MDKTFQAIMTEMMSRRLPMSGWKKGTCSYCNNRSFPDIEVVMVHKLPNKLKACINCFKRPDADKRQSKS